MRRLLVLIVSGVLALPALGACSSSEACLPAPLVATPATVASGSPVVLGSVGADCSGAAPDGTYRLTLEAQGGFFELGTVDVEDNGAFETTITVPPSISPGTARIVASGSTYDDCSQEDGAGCKRYTVDLEVTRP